MFLLLFLQTFEAHIQLSENCQVMQDEHGTPMYKMSQVMGKESIGLDPQSLQFV
jgi:hypothetical protein